MNHTTDYNPETGISTLRSVRGSLTIVNADDWCETLHVVQVGTEVLAAYARQGALDTAFDIIADYVVEHLPGYCYTTERDEQVMSYLEDQPHDSEAMYEVVESVMHENDYFTAGNHSDVFVSHEWYVIGSDCWSNRSKIEAVLGER